MAYFVVMKKLMILMVLVLCSCAPRHHVGETKAATKAQRDAANRVGSQFNGVR